MLRKFMAMVLGDGGALKGLKDARIILLGLDAAGKTTFLYRLKVGEIVTTIPTIGFNVETLEYKQLSLTCWDVGGCDKIRPLWRHYTQNTTAFIFVVDSNDRERIAEAREEITTVLREDELRDVPVLIFANKQDLPNSMSVAEVRDKLMGDWVHPKRQWHIVGTSMTEWIGATDGLDWLNQIINAKDKTGPSVFSKPGDTSKPQQVLDPKTGPPPPEPPFLSPTDVLDDATLLDKFQKADLESWDHKTHIRVAYTNLKKYGRAEGLLKVKEGIKNFIANSKISRKTTYHETMTIFWVQMIDYAISTTINPLESDAAASDIKKFDWFLEHNHNLMHGGLFLQYYTKEFMLNNAAVRIDFAPPDIKPLPTIAS